VRSPLTGLSSGLCPALLLYSPVGRLAR